MIVKMTFVEASREALREMMQADETVWCVGEDLVRGSVFGQYLGLQDEFGPDRVADTPISEAAIMGAAFGAAMVGTRPVVEMRFSDFALCATDELVNQIAKARFMFGGQSCAPMIIRKPIGLWRSSAAQHSQSLESWYVHIPGLVVAHESVVVGGFGAEVVATVAASRSKCSSRARWCLHWNCLTRSNPVRLIPAGPPPVTGRARNLL